MTTPKIESWFSFGLFQLCIENDDLENNDLENNDLENNDLENDHLENDDLENNDLENDHLENDDLKKTAGSAVFVFTAQYRKQTVYILKIKKEGLQHFPVPFHT